MSKKFPVLYYCSERPGHPDHNIKVPKSVPWSILEKHEPQALINHDQTLKRLAERGGLHPTEMVCILEDREFDKSMSLNKALATLATHLNH